MGQLIFAYCLAAFFALPPLLPAKRLERQWREATDSQLRDLRRMAESRWGFYLLGTWSFLSAVGATFAVARGHAIGWAWYGVAALYALGVFSLRRHQQRLLRLVGDRGRVERPERYQRRAAKSVRFVAVGVTGYIGMHVVDYAYPHQPPDWSVAVRGVFAIVFTVGAIGFLVIRARMYWSGDDLTPADRERPR
ncbi:hypothetical protein ASE12_11260 [Aeromicrobium sp. Root236]|uniref:hypothetical protein n=1 Tax=Aeromicrobium sp. Root236 TaxID=1736498 RepID=UPI0006F45601|nr:hypothetical protein [Aeromicrobium sp. Root236]KRC65291.1 hypothetical protein ASE12_11260 [Aeromicrobium sp. Root236]